MTEEELQNGSPEQQGETPVSPESAGKAPVSASELAPPIEPERVHYVVERAAQRAFDREDEVLLPTLDEEVRGCIVSLLQDSEVGVRERGLEWVSRLRNEEFDRRRKMTQTLGELAIRSVEASGAGGDQGGSLWADAKAEMKRPPSSRMRAVDN